MKNCIGGIFYRNSTYNKEWPIVKWLMRVDIFLKYF